MHLILFDCDGTLVDSQHNIITAMRRAFADAGLPAPADAAVRGIIGLSLHAAVQALAPEDTEPAVLQRLEQAYKEHFFRLRHEPDFHEPLFPGVREALQALHARDDVLLGIVTGKSRRGLEVLLERERLKEHFITLQTADDAPSKPHPGMVLQALEETGAEPQRTVVIGDTRYDMQMARAANTAALGVGWGYHPPRELLQAGAHALVHEQEALAHAPLQLLQCAGMHPAGQRAAAGDATETHATGRREEEGMKS